MGYRSTINRMLERTVGMRLVTIAGSAPRTPDICWMASPHHRDYLHDELTDVAFDTFAGTWLAADRAEVSAAVSDLMDNYGERPERSGELGQSQFHNLFWLWLTAQLVEPDIIVESGVFRGQSLWALHSACADAQVHAFDTDLQPLIERRPGVIYHEQDWSVSSVTASGRNGLAFFDCHVNQARRIREAYGRGFRTLLFDDAPPTHKLYAYGLPGVPTVPMLFDDTLSDGDRIEWQWRGEPRGFTYRDEHTHGAADLIEGWWTFPDIGASTMFGGFSFLTLVRLRV